ncbi:heterokaryon incompatibility protein-domain-containing protein [Xylaria sp. FL1042]|nr:heterokaryon incompatibility protein-domain-containing protein [Xylaria sp. FL1042]
MLSIEEPVHNQFRCAACLFGLQPGIPNLPQDLPIEAPFKPNIPKDDEHQVDLALLDQSSQRGCPVCSSIKSAIAEHYGSRELEDITWMRGGFYVGPMMDNWDVFTLANDDEYAPFRNTSPLTSEPNSQPFLGRFGFPTGDTASDKAVRRLQSWVSKCSKEHSHCGERGPTPMPHRILEIQDSQEPRVRLVDRRDMVGEYACLSHRWCEATTEASLVKKNLEMYKSMVPDHALYPLLKDAILVAGLAGLRFLWIDCLCIIQDDEEDWNIEAATMASVYENASLTIASSGCEGGHGLFYKSSQDNVTTVTMTGKEPVYIRPLMKHPVWKQGTTESIEFSSDPDYPLMSRGWVYQERALSKRIIHFTRQEILWECVEDVWCECKSSYPFVPSVLWIKSGSLDLHRRRSILNSEWDSIVPTFALMSLTFPSDRLPALSGIARRYGEHHGYKYLAGLWEQTIHRDFFWGRGNSDVGPRPRPNSSPTWSWASIMGHVRFLESSVDLQLVPELKPCGFLTFHGHEIEGVAGSDTYGKLRKALLHVSGPVVYGTLAHPSSWKSEVTRRNVFNRCEFHIGEFSFLFDADYDYTVQGPDYLPSGQIVACLITHEYPYFSGKGADRRKTKAHAQGIVLRPFSEEESSFERIGYLRLAVEVSLLLDRAKQMRIVLV